MPWKFWITSLSPLPRGGKRFWRREKEVSQNWHGVPEHAFKQMLHLHNSSSVTLFLSVWDKGEANLLERQRDLESTAAFPTTDVCKSKWLLAPKLGRTAQNLHRASVVQNCGGSPHKGLALAFTVGPNRGGERFFLATVHGGIKMWCHGKDPSLLLSLEGQENKLPIHFVLRLSTKIGKKLWTSGLSQWLSNYVPGNLWVPQWEDQWWQTCYFSEFISCLS